MNPPHAEQSWFFRTPGSRPLVVAHRGGAGLAPENTLKAFQHSILLGVDVIECDLRRTSEGFPVVFHDETLDRLTDVQGPLRDWRWAGLQRSARICKTEKIPLLEEVCASLMSQNIRLFLEVKEPDITAETISILEQMGWRGRAVLGSFLQKAVQEVSRSRKFPALQLLQSDQVENFLSSLDRSPESFSRSCEVVGLSVADTTPDRVDAIHKHGLAAWVWTANTHEEILHGMRCGADAIISDYPDRCLECL